MTGRALVASTLLVALLVMVLAGALLRPPTPGASPGARAASATPAPHPHGAVARRLMALQRAYNAGDVPRICRPGRLLDHPVVARLHEPGVPDCEADDPLQALTGT